MLLTCDAMRWPLTERARGEAKTRPGLLCRPNRLSVELCHSEAHYSQLSSSAPSSLNLGRLRQHCIKKPISVNKTRVNLSVQASRDPVDTIYAG